MTRFIGIDLGTSFFKGAVLDLERCRLLHARRVASPSPVSGLPAGRHELDPGAVLAAARELIGELLVAAPDAVGLVASSQMHCVVLTDPRGSPLTNIITWRDQRALEPHPSGKGSFLDVLSASVPQAMAREIGGELRAGVPVSTLFRLSEMGELPLATEAVAVSLPDFVISRLCSSRVEGAEPAAEATQAAASGLFDVAAGDWHRALIERIRCDRIRFPRVSPFTEVRGVASFGGERLRCFGAVGDQQAALAGVALSEGELSVNVSTGSQVSVLSSAPRPADGHQLRPYFDGKWLHTVVQLPAGRSLDVLVALLMELAQAGGAAPADPWALIDRALACVDSTDLEVDLSFFSGARAGAGSIRNIRADNFTAGHLFAAAFRAMAANFALAARRLPVAGGRSRVVFSGGLAQRFPRLRQETLAALGGDPDHRLAASSEDVLLGLLALALVCDGRAASVESAGRMVAEGSLADRG